MRNRQSNRIPVKHGASIPSPGHRVKFIQSSLTIRLGHHRVGRVPQLRQQVGMDETSVAHFGWRPTLPFPCPTHPRAAVLGHLTQRSHSRRRNEAGTLRQNCELPTVRPWETSMGSPNSRPRPDADCAVCHPGEAPPVRGIAWIGGALPLTPACYNGCRASSADQAHPGCRANATHCD